MIDGIRGPKTISSPDTSRPIITNCPIGDGSATRGRVVHVQVKPSLGLVSQWAVVSISDGTATLGRYPAEDYSSIRRCENPSSNNINKLIASLTCTQQK